MTTTNPQYLVFPQDATFYLAAPWTPAMGAASDFSLEIWVKAGNPALLASSYVAPTNANAPAIDYVNWYVFTAQEGAAKALRFVAIYYRASSQPNGTQGWWTQTCVVEAPLGRGLPVGTQPPFWDNEWHQVAATLHVFDMRLYVDGELVGGVDFTGPLTQPGAPGWTYAGALPSPSFNNVVPFTAQPALFPSSNARAPLAFGSNPTLITDLGNLPGNSFLGLANAGLDEVRLWSIALSPADLRLQLQYDLTGREPGLLAWYPLAGSLADASPTGNAAQLVALGGTSPAAEFVPGGFEPVLPQCAGLSGSGSYIQAPGGSFFDFGSGDFTAELWLSPGANQAGPLVTRMDNNGLGWGLLLDPTGTITFRTWAGAGSPSLLTTGPTTVNDGAWHHVAAVRRDNALLLYFDGKLAQKSLPLSPMDVSLSNSSAWPLQIGASSCPNLGSQNPNLAGSFDEVRIWNRALSMDEIDHSLYHRPNPDAFALVAAWSLDGNLNDITGKHDAQASGCTFLPAVIEEVPDGIPYLITQALLTQDFEANGTETTTYRVVISPRSKDNLPRSAVVDVTADADVTVQSGGQSWSLKKGVAQQFGTNALNQLTLVMPALGSAGAATNLYAPTLYLRADFMSANERVVVNADRQMFSEMAEVTGSDLQGKNGKTALLPSTYSATQAIAVAQTLNNVLATAVQHDLQPADPTGVLVSGTGKGPAKLDKDNFRAGRPSRPMYLPTDLCCANFDARTDQVRGVYIPEAVACVRAPMAQRCPCFQLNLQNCTFATLSATESQTIANSATSLDDNKDRNISSLWDQFVQGVTKAVNVVVNVIKKTAKAIVHTLEVVIQIGVDAYKTVVDTIEKAAGFVSGIFHSLGIAVENVIGFFRAVFHWDNLAPICQVGVSLVEQTFQALSGKLSQWQTIIDGKIDSLAAQVKQSLESVKAKTAPNKLTISQAGQSGTVQPQGSVHTQYLPTTLADHASSIAWPQLDVTLDSATMTQLTTALEGLPPLEKNSAYQQLGQMFLDSGGVLSATINALCTLLESLVDLAATAAKGVVHVLVAVCQAVLSAIQATLTATLGTIPIITQLFNKATGGKVSWTMLGLTTFIGAVAANAVHIEVAGKDAPPLVTPQTAANVAKSQAINGLFTNMVAADLSAPAAQGMAPADSSGQNVDSIPEFLTSKAAGLIQGTTSGFASGISTLFGTIAGIAEAAEKLSGVKSLIGTPDENTPLLARGRKIASTGQAQKTDQIGGASVAVTFRTAAAILGTPFPSFVALDPTYQKRLGLTFDAGDGLEIANWIMELIACAIDLPPLQAHPAGKGVKTIWGVMHMGVYYAMFGVDLAEKYGSPPSVVLNLAQNLIGGFPDVTPCFPLVAKATVLALTSETGPAAVVVGEEAEAAATAAVVAVDAAFGGAAALVELGRSIAHYVAEEEHWVW